MGEPDHPSLLDKFILSSHAELALYKRSKKGWTNTQTQRARK
jgi:hypothetical protein